MVFLKTQRQEVFLASFSKHERLYRAGLAANICNPSYSGGWEVQDLPGLHSAFKATLGK